MGTANATEENVKEASVSLNSSELPRSDEKYALAVNVNLRMLAAVAGLC